MSTEEIPGPRNGGRSKCLATTSIGKTPVVSKVYRRIPGDDDVGIEIICCGVCHTDLHQINNDWNNTIYPLVPGHEIIGIIRLLGSNVNEFYIGEKVAVGTYVDSCRKCTSCLRRIPQYCKDGLIYTYNSMYKPDDDVQTFGGYSTFIVVNRNFVFRIPHHLPIAGVAPLLCAGITVYSPMKFCRIGNNSSVGVAGIGGLGHVAVKIARALGSKVTCISTSSSKREAAKRLGASAFIQLTNPEEMKTHAGTMDLIIDTISADHEIGPYRKCIFGTCIGSPDETRELLSLCGAYNITADVEVASVDNIGEVLERLKNNDVKFRFVLDMRTLKDGFSGPLLQSTSSSVIKNITKQIASDESKSDEEDD
ncbi:hypothetical protein GJ496_004599 [Pomphorhynchus laevis]|nr:hypothetical protein GJ496_004599 [Pomphorhynchus laevis]